MLQVMLDSPIQQGLGGDWGGQQGSLPERSCVKRIEKININ